MIEKIENLLKKCESVCDYLISYTKKESSELYFVHEKLETVRKTDTNKINITVYVDHDSFRGDSKFEISTSDDDSTIEFKINEAVKIAKLVNNPYYELQDKAIEEFDSSSNIKNYDPMELGKIIAKDMIGLNTKEYHFNAIEIFVYKNIYTVKNSRGLDKTEKSYSAFIEAIPTYDKDDSVELYEDYRFNEFDEEYLLKRMQEKLNNVKQRYFAKKPNNKLNCKVLLRTSEILDLARELTYEANYSTTYNKQNVYNIGDSIQDNSISKLSIYRTNILGGKTIDFFDEDGVDLKETLIIKDGTLINKFGSNRYAYYYKECPTGLLKRFRVEATNTFDEINEDYLECVSFSGLQIDIQNDYIGGEVRLAYLHQSNTVYPITGISISGSLKEVLNGLTASSKKEINENYEGPASILASSFNIL